MKRKVERKKKQTDMKLKLRENGREKRKEIRIYEKCRNPHYPVI